MMPKALNFGSCLWRSVAVSGGTTVVRPLSRRRLDRLRDERRAIAAAKLARLGETVEFRRLAEQVRASGGADAVIASDPLIEYVLDSLIDAATVTGRNAIKTAADAERVGREILRVSR